MARIPEQEIERLKREVSLQIGWSASNKPVQVVANGATVTPGHGPDRKPIRQQGRDRSGRSVANCVNIATHYLFGWLNGRSRRRSLTWRRFREVIRPLPLAPASSTTSIACGSRRLEPGSGCYVT